MEFDEQSLRLDVPPPSLDEILGQVGITIMGGPTPWGSSWWSAFLKCPLEGALIREHGWGGDYKDYFFYGGLFHECMARIYRGLDVLEPVRAVQAWAQQNAAGVWAEHAAEVHAIASNVADAVVAYMGYWRPMPEGKRFDFDALGRYQIPASEILGVEMVVESADPFPYSTRIDIALRMIDWLGRPCAGLLDHKSTQDPKGDWNEAWWQDFQMAGIAYLWNKEMVPKGYPPARYYIINGIVRPTSHNRLRHPAFLRNIFPIRDSAIELWRRSMLHANELRLRCERARQKRETMQEPYQLHDVYPQNWASCFSRRYGRGRCPRLDYCLGLRPTEAIQTAATVPAQPAPPPHPVAPGEASAPAAGEVPLPSSPAMAGAEPVSPGASPPAVESSPPAVVACPKDADAVISLCRSSDPPIPAWQAVPGQSYYVAAKVVWALGYSERDEQERENYMFMAPGEIKIGYSPETLCYKATPILKGESTPPAPEAEPKEDAPADLLGKAFLSGTGEVPVLWLGAYNSGGKRLVARLGQIFDEPCFALAKVGRDPAKRAMKVIVRRDGEEPSEAKKTTLGSDLWVRLEGMLPEETSIAGAPPPPLEGDQAQLPGTEAPA